MTSTIRRLACVAGFGFAATIGVLAWHDSAHADDKPPAAEQPGGLLGGAADTVDDVVDQVTPDPDELEQPADEPEPAPAPQPVKDPEPAPAPVDDPQPIAAPDPIVEEPTPAPPADLIVEVPPLPLPTEPTEPPADDPIVALPPVEVPPVVVDPVVVDPPPATVTPPPQPEPKPTDPATVTPLPIEQPAPAAPAPQPPAPPLPVVIGPVPAELQPAAGVPLEPHPAAAVDQPLCADVQPNPARGYQRGTVRRILDRTTGLPAAPPTARPTHPCDPVHPDGPNANQTPAMKPPPAGVDLIAAHLGSAHHPPTPALLRPIWPRASLPLSRMEHPEPGPA